MLSANVIQNICEYVNYKELAILCQTNKKFQKSADSQELWKNEALRKYSTSLDFYQILDDYFEPNFSKKDHGNLTAN